MNILLTTSAAPIYSPFSTHEKRFPLGIGSLISVLRKEGHRVFFIDNYLKPSDFIERGYLNQNNIDIVGIYSDTICFRDSKRMFFQLERMRKKGIWKGKIIVGGPHASLFPESIPPYVDHIVIGEGEKSIVEILNGKVPRILKGEKIKDLNSLPMPAYDVFAKLPYNLEVEWLKKKPIFPMNTSRGCPYNCTFCSVGSVWGRRYSFFSAERIIEDIDKLVADYKIKGIYFREDNFTLRRDRVIQFCEILLHKDYKIRWACETRVDTLDKELIKLMHRAGCRAFYIGAESGSQRILDFLKKDITLDIIRDVVTCSKNVGIKVALSFVIGIPTETAEEQKETLNFIKELKPNFYWINVFVGLPKSHLYNYIIENNLYEHIDDRGLVYLKGHDELIEQLHRGKKSRKVNKGNEEELLMADSNLTFDDKRDLPDDVLLPRYSMRDIISRQSFAEKFLNKDMILLDTGCGIGWSSRRFAEICKNVIGIDKGKEAIDYAQKNYGKENLLFLKGDVTSLNFRDESIDAVIGFELIEHLSCDDVLKYLKEVNRVLKKDGLFIGTTPLFLGSDGGGTWRSSYSMHKYSIYELDRLFRNTFHGQIAYYEKPLITFYGIKGRYSFITAIKNLKVLSRYYPRYLKKSGDRLKSNIYLPLIFFLIYPVNILLLLIKKVISSFSLKSS